MKPGIPWSVKGIEPEVREAAKYAARRSGLSLGEWLNGIILEQADAEDDEDTAYEPPRRAAGGRGERLGRVAERLGRMDNSDTAAGRIYGRERGPDPRLVSDVLERLAANERRTESAFETIKERLEELASQVTSPRTREAREDQPGLRAVESAIRNIVSHMEVSEKRTREQLGEFEGKLTRLSSDDTQAAAVRWLEARIVELTRRIDKAESGEQAQELLGVMESHIARINERIDNMRQPGIVEMSRMRAEMSALRDRIDDLQHGAPDTHDMAVMKADLQTMADALRSDMARLGRRADIGGGMLRIEETQLQQQLAELEARVTVAEEQLVQMSVLETSIQEIMARLDAPQEPAPEAGPSAELSALEAALQSLSESARTADERSHAAIASLHDTLEEITARIAAIEAGSQQPEHVDEYHEPDQVRLDDVLETIETAEPISASAEAWQNILRAHVNTPAYTAPETEDPAIDPGAQAQPLRAMRLDAEPPAAETAQIPRTEDYVAAARRAALAAQSFDEPVQKKGKAKAAAQPANRRRKLLIAAVALLMAATAYTTLAPRLKPVQPPQAQGTSAPAKPAVTPAPSENTQAPPKDKSSSLAPPSGMASGESLNGGEEAEATAQVVATPVETLIDADFGPPALREAAIKGDAVAQFVAATRYLEGKGTKADAERAAKLFGQAAAQGLAPAQYRLATLYELGRGVPRNLLAARELYLKSASQGNVKSMHNLAVLLASNDGDQKPDYPQALSWFEKAARHGLPDSQYNLAVLHDRGAGTDADPVKAAFWYGVLAAKGDADAASRQRALSVKLTSGERKAVSKEIAAFKPEPPKAEANQVVVNNPAWQGDGTTASTSAAPAAAVSNSDIAEAQRILTGLGYPAGKATGKLDDRAANAVRVFQLQNGLPVNGMIDAALMGVLREKSQG